MVPPQMSFKFGRPGERGALREQDPEENGTEGDSHQAVGRRECEQRQLGRCEQRQQ